MLHLDPSFTACAASRAVRALTPAFVLVASLAVPHLAAAPLEGYPTEMSVGQGDTLELHVRSELARYRLSIWRQGRGLERVVELQTYQGQTLPVPAEAWERGCGWPVTCRVPIRPEWRPGAYLARVEWGSSFAWIPFVVRARVPGSYASMLVQLSTNTWQAYNRYGGKSLYGAHAPGLEGRAHRVSFHRPYNFFDREGGGQLFLWEGPFLTFLEREGYDYEVCTNYDVHRFPGLLDAYQVFVSVGHDEYWSKEQFDAVERHVDEGRNVAFLSANTLWWQVRFEDAGRTMVCYKSAGLDPLTGIDNARVTVNWHHSPVFRPPARLMGVYYNGSAGIPPGAYQVVNPRHWVFRGAAVDSGQAFGYPMVAYEVDARTQDSPPVLDVIARTELPDHNDGDVLRPAEMVYYERSPAYGWPAGRGGRVFACGTVNFTQGLVENYNGWTRTAGSADAVACAVARNVLDRLGCALAAPRPGFPADGGVARGPRTQLQWYAAAAQRATMPVRYTLIWQAEGAAAESLETTNLSALVPVQEGSTYSWWVEAASECGGVARSATWRFTADRPADSIATEGPPQLAAETSAGGMAIRLTLREAAEVKLGIYDISGRRVRFFDPRQLPAGTSRIEWDLRDQGGRRVASGVYFARAWIGRDVAQTKFSLLR